MDDVSLKKRNRVKAAPVDAIRSRNDIDRLREYFIAEYKYGSLYALMVTLGCNFGLRAGDLLLLTAGDLKGVYLNVIERKTRKHRRIFINGKARHAIQDYLDGFLFVADTTMIFSSQKGGAVTVKAFHRLIKKACLAIGLKGNFGTHTLRKTFAYHAFKYARDVAFVQKMFNHSDRGVTEMYLVGALDDVDECSCSFSEDEVYSMLNL